MSSETNQTLHAPVTLLPPVPKLLLGQRVILWQPLPLPMLLLRRLQISAHAYRLLEEIFSDRSRSFYLPCRRLATGRVRIFYPCCGILNSR
jgi:hypothetical protein